MKISIVQGHHLPESRTTKVGLMWSQRAYAHLGGAFPAEIKVSLQSPQDAYPVGEYELSDESFGVGQYGDLEINRFNFKLVPASAALKSAPTAVAGK